MSVSIKHMVNGKEYEIKVVPTQSGFEVRTYRHRTQIGWTYSATQEIADAFNVTAAQITGQGAVASLVNCAKDDLNRGITSSDV